MNKKFKTILSVACAMAICASLCVCAFASAAPAAATSDSGTAITSTMSFFISYVVDLFRCVGVLVGVYAIAQFALAFKDDNPDQKTRSTTMLVIAVMLIMVKTLAKKVIELTSISGISLDEGFLGG